MPNRLSKAFGRAAAKEKEALAETTPDQSGASPPPAYSQPPPEFDHDNILDPPDLTAGFSNLQLSNSTTSAQSLLNLPTADECIAHLKVLECFYRLRRDVGSSNGLYGIFDYVVLHATVSDPLDDKDEAELLARLAEKRWAIFVTRAVDRFEQWLDAIAPVDMLRSSPSNLRQRMNDFTRPPAASPLVISQDSMPPVDVLMVWHAYMLNPRAYMEDCIRSGRLQLWFAKFAWLAASQCINSETFQYSHFDQAREMWTGTTGLPWDLLSDDNAGKILDCACGYQFTVPWTTCVSNPPQRIFSNKTTFASAVDLMLSDGTGYCDKDFHAACPGCSAKFTHERLRARKFCDDLELLMNLETPMPGTLLGHNGLTFDVGNVQETEHSSVHYTVNRLFSCGLGSRVLRVPGHLQGKYGNDSVDGIRSIIEDGMRDGKYMRNVRSCPSGTMTRGERIALRKVMDRYWDNHSPFSLDLVGAVIRQGAFVEKMHNIDWLHSPALPSTMKRLLVKYERFVGLMADRYNMAVPTLDVDLAWHTHQLHPVRYLHYSLAKTGQFIDHDDKVPETKLNDAFAWTSKTYQKLYNEPYSECTCWYCEAVRESHTSAASRLFNTTSSRIADQLHDSGMQDPRKSVHISAHNAIRPTDSAKRYETRSLAKAKELEQAYSKACKRAIKKGKTPPKRDDYYYSDAYGYPVYIPAYAPYVGPLPYYPLFYPVAPGCMALGAGAVGNCCSGTCGAAGGGCAGAAMGGCSSGGGCGSSGGGCGGGGGGGGCGGGGGGGGGCGGGGGGGC